MLGKAFAKMSKLLLSYENYSPKYMQYTGHFSL